MTVIRINNIKVISESVFEKLYLLQNILKQILLSRIYISWIRHKFTNKEHNKT